MELSPYLMFNGNCAEAFTFYERCLGGRIVSMQTHGESPMKDNVPEHWRDKIIHARMTVGETVLMGSDTPPEHYARPQGFHVTVGLTSVADGHRIFAALSEGGTVVLPFQKMFWAPGFGMAVDRFGVPWMVNCEERA